MSGMSGGGAAGNIKRRIGRIALLVVICLSVLSGSVIGAALYREDVNADGRVDILDAVKLLIIGRADPSDPRADFNGDAVWSVQDVTTLLDNIRRGLLTPVDTAIPRITLAVDSLAFGNVELGTGLSLYFEIYNQGDTTLVVRKITVGDSTFVAGPDSLWIEPSDSGAVEVTYSPAATGEIRTVLSIFSNDPTTDSLTVTLSGTGIVTVTNKTHVILMPGLVFSPDTLTIAVGDTVTWNNNDVIAHTTTSGAGGVKDNIWDSGNMNPGQTFSRVFTQAGNFPYYCLYHIGARMFGLIRVE